MVYSVEFVHDRPNSFVFLEDTCQIVRLTDTEGDSHQVRFDQLYACKVDTPR